MLDNSSAIEVDKAAEDRGAYHKTSPCMVERMVVQRRRATVAARRGATPGQPDVPWHAWLLSLVSWR